MLTTLIKSTTLTASREEIFAVFGVNLKLNEIIVFQYVTEIHWKSTFLHKKFCNILLKREIKFRKNFFPSGKYVKPLL